MNEQLSRYRIYARDCDGYGAIQWLPDFDDYEEAVSWCESLSQDSEFQKLHIVEI